MPARSLPNDPSLEHLRKQAKRLHKGLAAGDKTAVAQVQEFHPRASSVLTKFTLAHAQLVIARSYGFASWTKLKEHLVAIAPFVWSPPPMPDASSPVDLFIRLACLDYGVASSFNATRAKRLLQEHPELTRANVYAAAAAGDVAAIAAMIVGDPSLIHVKGGPLRWEPLLYACYSRIDGIGSTSTLDVSRLLLEHGADPNAGFLWDGIYTFTALTGVFGRGEDWDNQPPHPACDALATLLLEAGADPNDSQTLYNRHFKENDDHLKLLFAYGLGHDKGGPWLRRLGGQAETPTRMLVQQLCWAAMHNFPARVALLVEHGVDVNGVSGRSGRTAYQEARRAGHDAIAGYLLQHGAKRIELDPVETFAKACIAGRRDEVRARLADDPSLLDKLGDYGRAELMHRAVDANKPEGVRLIAELGIDVNGIVFGTGLDRTPMHNAAMVGNLEMVKLLLELGANPQARDQNYHATPYGWAAYTNQPHVMQHLLRYTTIFEAVQSGQFDRVAELLEKDPSLATSIDADGTPLAWHLHPGAERLDEMIPLLLRHGMILNAPNKGGNTLLDLAIKHGVTDFADLLRAHGARPSS